MRLIIRNTTTNKRIPYILLFGAQAPFFLVSDETNSYTQCIKTRIRVEIEVDSKYLTIPRACSLHAGLSVLDGNTHNTIYMQGSLTKYFHRVFPFTIMKWAQTQ